MRAIPLLLMVGSLAMASCYNQGDLGPEPFKCSSGGTANYPECPDSYVCGTDPSVKLVGKTKDCPSNSDCVCVFACNDVNQCPIMANDCIGGICVIKCTMSSPCPSSMPTCSAPDTQIPVPHCTVKP